MNLEIQHCKFAATNIIALVLPKLTRFLISEIFKCTKSAISNLSIWLVRISCSKNEWILNSALISITELIYMAKWTILTSFTNTIFGCTVSATLYRHFELAEEDEHCILWHAHPSEPTYLRMTRVTIDSSFKSITSRNRKTISR